MFNYNYISVTALYKWLIEVIIGRYVITIVTTTNTLVYILKYTMKRPLYCLFHRFVFSVYKINKKTEQKYCVSKYLICNTSVWQVRLYEGHCE